MSSVIYNICSNNGPQYGISGVKILCSIHCSGNVNSANLRLTLVSKDAVLISRITTIIK